MILNNLYENFVRDTGLTNNTYKTVFSKISESLEKIKDIRWNTLSYEYGDNKSFIDFNVTKEININTSEIFANIFDEFYTFPKDSKAMIELEYNNILYQIAYSNGLIIDNKIRFIKDDSLFNFFIQNRKVTSLFHEFDRYFKFVDNYRLYPTQVPPQLVKRFENRTAQDLPQVDNEIQSKILDSQILIEKLQEQQKKIMIELDKKQADLKELSDRKQSVVFAKNNIANLTFEKDRLINESKVIQDQGNQIKIKLSKIENILKEINLAIKDNVDFGNVDVDIKLLTEKKIYFEREEGYLQNNYNDTHKLSLQLQANLTDISKKLVEAEGFVKDDVALIEKNINAMEVDREELYTTLESITLEIKNYKNRVAADSLTIEKTKSLMNEGIADIERNTITESIMTPLQPSYITTVMNYLRYVFVYEAEKMKQILGTDNNIIVCRQVLTDVFGLYFQNAFISVDYKFNRHDNLIGIK